MNKWRWFHGDFKTLFLFKNHLTIIIKIRIFSTGASFDIRTSFVFSNSRICSSSKRMPCCIFSINYSFPSLCMSATFSWTSAPFRPTTKCTFFHLKIWFGVSNDQKVNDWLTGGSTFQTGLFLADGCKNCAWSTLLYPVVVKKVFLFPAVFEWWTLKYNFNILGVTKFPKYKNWKYLTW